MPAAEQHVPQGVVFGLGFSTWGDARRRDFGFSPDRMAAALLADPQIADLTVVDDFRSRLGRLKSPRLDRDQGFPTSGRHRIVHPLRWPRRDPTNPAQAARHYTRLDQALDHHRPPGVDGRVLVTGHPLHAAVADRSCWSDVVYYGWDDWLSYPPKAPWHPAIERAYRAMSERDVHVIGVSQALVERIGAPRSTVIPNGVDTREIHDLPQPPAWFEQLPRPLAFYSGALQQRVDTAAIAAAAATLQHWTFCLIGPMTEPQHFAGLDDLPNVHVHEAVPRRQVLAMAAAATVCLVPHRRTPLTVAMSPLKLYEYLAVGAPVVAADLPPMRGVSDRVRLIEPGTSYATAIEEAARISPPDPLQHRAWLQQHDWAARYARWKAAIFSGVTDHP